MVDEAACGKACVPLKNSREFTWLGYITLSEHINPLLLCAEAHKEHVETN